MKAEKTSENKVLVVALVVLTIVIVGLLFLFKTPADKPESVEQKAGSGVSFDIDRIALNGNDKPAQLSDFTTLIPAATNSLPFNIERADAVDLNFAFHSTSTPVTLAWYYEFSHSTTTGWFREDIQSTSGATVTHQGGTASSSPTIHTWTPTTASSTVFKNIHVNQSGFPFGARYMRLNLDCWAASGQHCKWWGEALLKRPL